MVLAVPNAVCPPRPSSLGMADEDEEEDYGGAVFEVERIVRKRVLSYRINGTKVYLVEYLVKWRGGAASANSEGGSAGHSSPSTSQHSSIDRPVPTSQANAPAPPSRENTLP